MTLSTTGAPSNGLVYITMSGKDSAGNSIVEQGSGILLSNDEVLTAAHIVYNPDGSLRTSGTAAVGYSRGQSNATSMVDGVQANAHQDYTTVPGMGSDFAVVHLSTPVTDGTIFQLGSDLTSGTFQVSGYPVGMSGALDTKTENLSVASGTEVYTGETLHDGSGNPNGSSGGSIYQIIDGAPTAFGVISAALNSDNTKGVFKELTAADIAQIKGWVATADSAKVTPLAATTVTTLAPAATATAVSHSAPGFHDDMSAMLTADAAAYSGGRQAAMVDVAAAITKACQDGGSFSDMASGAANYLYATSPNASRDVAYLAGVLSGTTGSWISSIKQTANKLITGSVFSASTKNFAQAGRQEGLGMGITNTGAIIDQGSATLADAITGAGPMVDARHVHGGSDTTQHAFLAADHLGGHGRPAFG